MAADFAELCERIRQHCQQRGWYGPDSEYDSWIAYREGRYHGSGGHMWTVANPPVEGFTLAPATSEQIVHTEQVVGRELSAALKAIYLSLANGGFGPGYGLVGVSGLTAVTRADWRLSERAARYLEEHPERYLECDQVPEGLVLMCDWGCGLTSMLDLNTGRVYGLGAGSCSDWNGVESGAGDYVLWMDFQASSVEDWFERWLRGALDQPFARLEGLEDGPPEPDAWSGGDDDEDW